jgi:hypothetical protein
VPKKIALFYKAHIKSYSKKSGATVIAHEDKRRPACHNHAEAAVSAASRVEGPTGPAGLAASKHALSMTRANPASPATHKAAASAHDDAASTHKKAQDSLKYSGVGGMRGPGAMEHGTAVNLHRWAAASHREEAAKGP